LSIQEHSVEQVALSSAVHAGNSYNTDWPLYLLHHLHNFLVYFKLAVAADGNKRKSFFLEFVGFFGGTLFLLWGLKDFPRCEMFLHLQCCAFEALPEYGLVVDFTFQIDRLRRPLGIL